MTDTTKTKPKKRKLNAETLQDNKPVRGKGAVSDLDQQINMLKTIQKSEEASNADKISAAKTIQMLRKQDVIEDTVPLSAMSRADLEGELRRCDGILKGKTL